jgi:hypothetical protein
VTSGKVASSQFGSNTHRLGSRYDFPSFAGRGEKAIAPQLRETAVPFCGLRNRLSLDTSGLMEENPANCEVEVDAYTLRRL